MDMNKALKIMNLTEDELLNLTLDKLKKIYHKNALIYHPDKGGTDEEFKELQEANEYLVVIIELNNSKNCNENQENLFHNISKTLFNYISSLSFSYINDCDNKEVDNIEKILDHYKDKIPEALYLKITKILKKFDTNNDHIILKPTLDELLENKIYRLNYHNEIFNVPLWHSELYYDTNNNNEICVKCIPDLPVHIDIDMNNNLLIYLIENKDKIFKDQYLNVKLTSNYEIKIFTNEINLLPIQTILIKNKGISKILNSNIYDTKIKSDLIITLQLY